MKQSRHEKILELISQHDIGTQEDLLELLRADGFDVTQATVSRDIKELRLIKALSGSGDYAYSTGKLENYADMSSKFDSLFKESVIRMDTVFNQIIIKCYAGLANAVCASLDVMHYEDIVGTLAGDDTILIIMRSEQAASVLFGKLHRKL
ncbi:MAG: arginine repressor [Clostridia bacterium]|nr:arginine repressor [Clostridia bacterium]